ncbi:hypothetical protein LUZ60_003048 [Juncus effusus]|nr:hypothetical protein LUZ60_003048 [Juncus effusus]
MFRRCVRDLSSVRSFRKTPPRTPSHTPYLLSARNEFSTAAPKPKEENKSKGGLLLGGLLGLTVGGALAYRNGKLDFLFNKSPLDNTSVEQNDVKIEEKKEAFEEKVAPVESKMEEIVRSESEKQADVDLEKEIESEPDLKDQNVILENEKDQSENLTRDEEVKDREEEIVVSENTSNEISKTEKDEEMDEKLVQFLIEEIDNIESNSIPSHDENVQVSTSPVNNEKTPENNSLLDSYSLQETKTPETISSQKDETADVSTAKDKTEINFHNSDKENIMLDLVEAIHAAERKQAESDAYIFAEEKRRLKEKYEKELKDARVREVMFAEEVAMLEKELNKEKARALAAIKSLQEKAEQNLKEQLQHKEEEMEIQLEKTNELAKAELAAAIAKEKALQIERISEANLNINALCMAFYARSEEARQSHSVHNLALAALGMEEALSKGLPLKGEVDSLRESLQSIDKDSLLQLAVSSLPKEALDYGTDTQMELSIKFNALKGILRHFSLIPAGGGGILTHAVASLASSIKMREADESKDGIESLITRVERLITSGKLAEAADELELGLHGTEAEEAMKQWVRQARARAVAEQTLTLLQSYASSVSSFSS